ncbi:MAG: amidohydrolase [Acidobacteria bacterium]|nr:amidohydrolase [Acidobacteriota bacterium]
MSFLLSSHRLIPLMPAWLLLGFLWTPGPPALAASGQTPDDERIAAATQSILTEITEERHQIHQHPELGNRETRTAALVAEHLRKLGLEVKTGIAYTGVVGILKGGRPGPVIAVRADMDGLPVTEDTGYAFASTDRTSYLGKEVGVMHACGHDIHTAVQLGVASVMASFQEDLPGTIQFIFQPAEEGPPPGEKGGAELMLEEGLFRDLRPEVVFGLHTFAEMEVGKVGYTVGPAFAAVDHFRARIIGRQSHGAQPQQSVDPVVMAAQTVMGLQTIRSRNLHPLEPSVVTVGIVRGGERFNIIPAEVLLEGTVRTYDPEVRDIVERRMHEILGGITQAGGGSYEMDYQRGSPATINDVALARWAVPVMTRVVGAANITELPPTMGGEDFALFANEVPGFYYRLGIVQPGTVSGGHHTPTFKADDASLEVGIRVMSTILVDYLASGGLR